MTIAVGTKVSDFTLKSHTDQEFKLEDYKGKKVLLSFHPLAWTRVCYDQMQSLEHNLPVFERLNTVAVGVSVDTVPSKKAWAKELGIEKTPLLSDFWPHGELAKALDIFREKDGFSERANIILDEEHNVIFAKTYPLRELPDIEEIFDVLEGKK